MLDGPALPPRKGLACSQPRERTSNVIHASRSLECNHIVKAGNGGRSKCVEGTHVHTRANDNWMQMPCRVHLLRMSDL